MDVKDLPLCKYSLLTVITELSCCHTWFPPTARIPPPPLPAKPSSRPYMVRSSSPCYNSMDITLPTPPGLPTLELQPNLCNSSREVPSTEPQQKSTPVCCSAVVQQVSTTSIKISRVTPARVTPVISVNTPVFRCPAIVNPLSTTYIQTSQVTPG